MPIGDADRCELRAQDVGPLFDEGPLPTWGQCPNCANKEQGLGLGGHAAPAPNPPRSCKPLSPRLHLALWGPAHSPAKALFAWRPACGPPAQPHWGGCAQSWQPNPCGVRGGEGMAETQRSPEGKAQCIPPKAFGARVGVWHCPHEGRAGTTSGC